MLEILWQQIEPLVVHLPIKRAPLALILFSNYGLIVVKKRCFDPFTHLSSVFKVVHVYNIDEGTHSCAIVCSYGLCNEKDTQDKILNN